MKCPEVNLGCLWVKTSDLGPIRTCDAFEIDYNKALRHTFTSRTGDSAVHHFSSVLHSFRILSEDVPGD